jgi:hypothetical protein
MTPEERQMLAGLFDRVQSASSAPRDREAEAFIAEATRAIPAAPYVMAQTILVQEEALRAANARVQQLEAEAKDAQANAAPVSFLGGIGKSIFGGAAPAQPPQPQAQPGSPWGRQVAAPQQPAPGGWGQQPAAPQPAPWGGAPQYAPQQQGGGFLKGALGAAAGVAGGVLLADSIRGMMGGHNSPFGMPYGGGGVGGFGGGETIVNNYYGSDSQDALRRQDYAQDARQDAADYDNAAYDDNSPGGDDTTDV